MMPLRVYMDCGKCQLYFTRTCVLEINIDIFPVDVNIMEAISWIVIVDCQSTPTTIITENFYLQISNCSLPRVSYS